MDGLLKYLLMRLFVPLLGPPIARIELAVGESWRRYRSQGWPMAFGRVHRVDVHQPQYVWVATIVYSYEAAGEFYSGELSLNFGRERDADAFCHQYPPGMQLFVRYKAGKPEVSLLQFKENSQAMSAVAAR